MNSTERVTNMLLGKPYDLYFGKYQDKFAILGGINIQNALGILGREELEAEIRRVFGLLRGKRWAVWRENNTGRNGSMAYVRRFCGPILYTFDGALSRADLIALLATSIL